MRKEPISEGGSEKRLSRFANFLWDLSKVNRSAIAFSIGVLTVTLGYRIQLTWALLTHSVRPFDFNPSNHPIWFMARYFFYDALLILLCFLLSWLGSHVLGLVRKRRIQIVLKIIGMSGLHLFLIAFLVIHGSHTRLLFETQTGFNTFVLQELFLNVPWAELIKFVEWRDGIFLLASIGLFWGVFLLPVFFRVRLLKISAGLIVFLSLLSIFGMSFKPADLPAELRINPALFFITDLLERGGWRASPEERYHSIVKEGDLRIQPEGSDYQERFKALKFLPPQKDQPWNIVLFIMESVGSQYIFDTRQGRMPMPFLHGLARESWYLKNHYTSSNISTKAIFSLLSGLYDFFNQETFGLRSDAHVPSLYNYLPKNYEGFLVTPSPIQWYFPTSFVKNSGLREMHHFENLNLRAREEKHSFGRYIGRDEIQTIDFFNRRIRQAREPFIGIYYSFTAHLPYFDYGPDYHITPPDDRLINRYYNNLNLLDHMLRRVYDTLKQEGLLERTIFVIVGDHGQAFGQHHADNYMHHRYSYSENLKAPMIIHQPALFRPKTFDIPTSHVDLLPTLLDAMRIPYPAELLDGESLFHHRLRRKYIFVYGYEGTITSIDLRGIKVQYSFKKNRCWAFDLKVDPEEKFPLDCSSFGRQFEALRRFTTFHDSSLVRYNEWLKRTGGDRKGG